MTDAPASPLPAELPVATQEVLTALVAAAAATLQEDLRSIILFGSGAEGRLRPSSDLNLLIVLDRWQRERIDALREPLRMARMAQRTEVMWACTAELPLLAETFAVKFDDLRRRHRILWGEDVLATIAPTREARWQRLRQVLLNLALRLRERYAALSLRDEQLIAVIGEHIGPLRAAAATLLELEGRPAAHGRAALIAVVHAEMPEAAQMLALIAQARKTGALPPGQGGPLTLKCLQLVEKMQVRNEALR